MKMAFILSILIPCVLFSNMQTLKKELELRTHKCLVEITYMQFMSDKYIRTIERCETFYEVIDIIDQLEYGVYGKKEETD